VTIAGGLTKSRMKAIKRGSGRAWRRLRSCRACRTPRRFAGSGRDVAHDVAEALLGELEGPRVAAGVLLHLQGADRDTADVGGLAGAEGTRPRPRPTNPCITVKWAGHQAAEPLPGPDEVSAARSLWSLRPLVRVAPVRRGLGLRDGDGQFISVDAFTQGSPTIPQRQSIGVPRKTAARTRTHP
jgi:hypothetical protein